MEHAQATSPTRFGRYVLLDCLGKGGMAEVFRAIMPGAEGFKRTLVVKRILPRFSASAQFVDMFVREARIGALLNHPGIVQVSDFGSVEGQYYLAMEYLRGRDVLAVIRRLHEVKRPFPVPVAVFIAHEVARCLGYAHALTGPDGNPLNIVHRDVSPSNIMCLREGGVKLLDFGIARAVGEVPADEEQQKKSFKGKLAYMAPEALRREPIDGRADLYAVGVVLWEMLTGRRLFAGRDEAETLRNVLEMQVPPPSSRRPDIPARLDAIVMRALARPPGARYQTGAALAEDLEQVLHETRFKATMLPQLLVDVFGSGLRSAQIAVSSELLAEATGSAGTSSGTGSISGSLHPADAPAPRRRTVALVGAAAGAAALLFMLGFWRWRSGSGDSSPPPAAAVVVEAAALPQPAPPVTAPQPAVAPPVEQAAAAAPPALEPAAEVEPAPVVTARPARPKPAARRKPAGARGQEAENPIGKGLSIDPFAEAATRGRR